MSDPGLEPGDAGLVELTLAVHHILCTNLILGQRNVHRLSRLATERVLVTGDDLDGKVSGGSLMGLDLVVVDPGALLLLLVFVLMTEVA